MFPKLKSYYESHSKLICELSTLLRSQGIFKEGLGKILIFPYPSKSEYEEKHKLENWKSYSMLAIFHAYKKNQKLELPIDFSSERKDGNSNIGKSLNSLKNSFIENHLISGNYSNYSNLYCNKIRKKMKFITLLEKLNEKQRRIILIKR